MHSGRSLSGQVWRFLSADGVSIRPSGNCWRTIGRLQCQQLSIFFVLPLLFFHNRVVLPLRYPRQPLERASHFSRRILLNIAHDQAQSLPELIRIEAEIGNHRQTTGCWISFTFRFWLLLRISWQRVPITSLNLRSPSLSTS